MTSTHICKCWQESHETRAFGTIKQEACSAGGGYNQPASSRPCWPASSLDLQQQEQQEGAAAHAQNPIQGLRLRWPPSQKSEPPEPPFHGPQRVASRAPSPAAAVHARYWLPTPAAWWWRTEALLCAALFVLRLVFTLVLQYPRRQVASDPMSSLETLKGPSSRLTRFGF